VGAQHQDKTGDVTHAISMSQMNILNMYPLPYTAPHPPPELFRGFVTASDGPDRTAFITGLDKRDVFFGTQRCVVCGEQGYLVHCHIIGHLDVDMVHPICN
jgi:hypothetical protein